MTIIETEEIDGYTVEIQTMEGPENPREDRDHEGSLIVQLSGDYIDPSRADRADWRYDPVREAWKRTVGHRRNGYSLSHMVYDDELIRRYARTFLNAAAVEIWDDPTGSSKLVSIIDRDSDYTDPESACKAELAEYVAWCVGDVFGYTVTAPDGEEIDSCWGYYGDDSWDKRVESTIRANDVRPRQLVRWGGEDRRVRSVIGWGALYDISFDDETAIRLQVDSPITLVHPGYMRDAFMSAITVHQRDLAERLAKEAAAAADDEAEIVEMRLAEVGV